MTPDEREALHALLAQMRTLQRHLGEHHVGVCTLHLEAAVAALESHLRRNGVPLIEELRQELTSAPVAARMQAAAD